MKATNAKNIQSNFQNLPDEALIRQHTLIKSGITPFSASTLWRKCKANQFPAPIKVSASITAWRVGEIRDWLANPGNYIADNMPAAKNTREESQTGTEND